MSTKICTKCHQEKERTDFYNRSWCKACTKAYNIAYNRTKYQVDPDFRQAKKDKVRLSREESNMRVALKYALLNKAILDEAQLSQCSAQLQCI